MRVNWVRLNIQWSCGGIRGEGDWGVGLMGCDYVYAVLLYYNLFKHNRIIQ